MTKLGGGGVKSRENTTLMHLHYVLCCVLEAGVSIEVQDSAVGSRGEVSPAGPHFLFLGGRQAEVSAWKLHSEAQHV